MVPQKENRYCLGALYLKDPSVVLHQKPLWYLQKPMNELVFLAKLTNGHIVDGDEIHKCIMVRRNLLFSHVLHLRNLKTLNV
jgi:hypothetical protein